MFRLRTQIAIVFVALIVLVGGGYFSAQSHKKADSAALRALADKGDAVAQYNMALRYERGDGVPQAFYQVGYYLRLSSLQGHPQAQAKAKELHALCYPLSPYNLDKNPKRTVEQAHACQADAELGDRDAELVVALSHERGDLLEKNRVIAAVWFKAAAMKGDPIAQFMLARSFSETGPLPNPREEYAWLATAVANPDMPSELASLARISYEAFQKTYRTRYGEQALNNAEDTARVYISKYIHNNTGNKGIDK